jgi:ABC-type glutathione transport system ATPase component
MNHNGNQPAIAPPVIEIVDLSKVYVMGQSEVHALHGVSLTIARGEYVAIIGASGSGKSTLMNMIGLLDRRADARTEPVAGFLAVQEQAAPGKRIGAPTPDRRRNAKQGYLA